MLTAVREKRATKQNCQFGVGNEHQYVPIWIYVEGPDAPHVQAIRDGKPLPPTVAEAVGTVGSRPTVLTCCGVVAVYIYALIAWW
jgi:hypothetical protein